MFVTTIFILLYILRIFSFHFQGYKVYYTVNPTLAMASWESQMVDNNQLTTISELTPHVIYTIRVQAFTSVGPGPLSLPVLVKTQQGGKVYLVSSVVYGNIPLLVGY
jgi:hypothetical protein